MSPDETLLPPVRPPPGFAPRLLLVAGEAGNATMEELVMRGYLVTRLIHLTRHTSASIVIAALPFASYHSYQGMPGVLSALLMGVVYGAAFRVSGSLGPLIVGHAAHNLYFALL